MLTPEEMARIEEDERRKHAEEQYRRVVRSRLQEEPEVKGGLGVAPKVIGLTILCAIAAIVALSTNFKHASTDAPLSAVTSNSPNVRYAVKTDQIASGQVVVPHGREVFYKILITPQMRQARVAGSFNASGGTGNDVAGIIAGESDFTNWSNGHQAKAYWSTQGRETTGTFDVRLGPGTYYLAFSNKFSAVTDKYLFLNAQLNYQQAESN